VTPRGLLGEIHGTAHDRRERRHPLLGAGVSAVGRSGGDNVEVALAPGNGAHVGGTWLARAAVPVGGNPENYHLTFHVEDTAHHVSVSKPVRAHGASLKALIGWRSFGRCAVLTHHFSELRHMVGLTGCLVRE
jgi:hypothetical protein